jgi:hypothetical protein
MKLKISILQILVLAICLITPCLLHAQPGFTDDTSDVPIDGGLSLLVAAGVGYGAKQLKRKRNKI